MIEADVDNEKWPRHIKTILTGATLVSYSRSIPDEKKRDYHTLNNALLNVRSDCTAQFFIQSKKTSWTEAGRWVEFQVERIMAGCETLKEANNNCQTTNMVFTRVRQFCQAS